MVLNTGHQMSRRAAIVGSGIGALAVATTGGRIAAGFQAGTPRAESSHPAPGVWQWTNYPDQPNTDISYAIFTENGTYADAWYGRLVSVGEWRETGERTADLIIITHELTSLTGLFSESQSTIPEDLYEATPPTIWRIALEFDETGNQFTATGTAETLDADGNVLDSQDYTGRGDRMTLVAGATSAS